MIERADISTRIKPIPIVASVLLLVGLNLSGMVSARRNPCVLPSGLREQLLRQYPEARLVGTADLSEEHRKLFRKDHAESCPGAVSVDFYGDNQPTWAVVLFESRSTPAKAHLAVAQMVNEQWNVRDLETADAAIVPVVWKEAPGKYSDITGETTMRAPYPVIVFAGYESWAIVYAWIEGQVERVWTSD